MNGKVTSTALATLMVITTMLLCSTGWAADIRQVWLANSPILMVTNDAGGYTVAQRVNDIQLRANDLFPFGKSIPKFTIAKSGMDSNIYADKEFLMTVTAADARANGTSSWNLAKIYAGRMGNALPQVISLYQPSGVKLSHVDVPRNTVVAVTLDKPLSSATSKIGDNFYAYQEGMNGGFPQHTKFTGRIESVTRASGRKAGQIGISFVSAKLPDGTRLPIMGKLISLDERSVKMDPATGRLIGTSKPRRADNKFIAYGAGAGLVIGQAIGNRPFLGAVLGAGSGYLYGQKQVRPAIGKDVQVSAGTGFGIGLSHSVTLADTTPADVGRRSY